MGYVKVMTLLDHLRATEEGVSAFADRLGQPRSTIRKIAYGQRRPSLPLAVKIVEATRGKVGVSDLLAITPRKAPVEQVAAA